MCGFPPLFVIDQHPPMCWIHPRCDSVIPGRRRELRPIRPTRVTEARYGRRMFHDIRPFNLSGRRQIRVQQIKKMMSFRHARNIQYTIWTNPGDPLPPAKVGAPPPPPEPYPVALLPAALLPPAPPNPNGLDPPAPPPPFVPLAAPPDTPLALDRFPFGEVAPPAPGPVAPPPADPATLQTADPPIGRFADTAPVAPAPAPPVALDECM